MDRKFLVYAMAVVLIFPIVFGVGYWSYWNFYLRYKPVTITKDQAAIEQLLGAADYVSPYLGETASGTSTPRPFVYLITSRHCTTCRAYEDSEFPKFSAAGIDTRVIVYAPEGIDQSKPEDRSTVAELWLNRSWTLYTLWRNDPVWDAPNIRPADGDLARTAVVDAGRKFFNDLKPLLTENRVDIRHPLVIWRDANNQLKVCACSDEKMYHFVREDLGAPNHAPEAVEATPLSQAAASAIMGAASSSSASKAPETKPESKPESKPEPKPQADLGPGAPEVTTVKP